MNDNEFKKRTARLQEVAAIIEKMPAEMRASAFELLSGYVSGEASESPAHPKKKVAEVAKATPETAESDTPDMEGFFGAFDHEKPSENVYLIVAYFYREHGIASFTVDEVRDTATNVGLTIPNRPDMTLAQGKEKGKSLFKRDGQGGWQPTVHGEAYLKRVYSVTKGKKKKAAAPE